MMNPKFDISFNIKVTNLDQRCCWDEYIFPGDQGSDTSRTSGGFQLLHAEINFGKKSVIKSKISPKYQKCFSIFLNRP